MGDWRLHLEHSLLYSSSRYLLPVSYAPIRVLAAGHRVKHTDRRGLCPWISHVERKDFRELDGGVCINKTCLIFLVREISVGDAELF